MRPVPVGPAVRHCFGGGIGEDGNGRELICKERIMRRGYDEVRSICDFIKREDEKYDGRKRR